ncbi:MAG: SdrD B-like domain-containing protein [Thermoleophilaceae bacterium]
MTEVDPGQTLLGNIFPPMIASDVDTVRSADVSLTRRGNGDFLVGENGFYALEVRNDGPSASTGPTLISDKLPAGLSFVSGTGPGWTCSAMGQQILCSRSGGLAAGATSAVTLTVLVTASSVPSGTRTAVASSSSSDPVPGNNSISDSTSVQGAQIGDLVYEDSDGDGTRDQGERGLEGVKVVLRRAGAAEAASTRTDADGAYTFDELPAGDYEVDIARSAGYMLTSGEDPRPVRLAAGEVFGEADFGFQRRDASIAGVIFDDADGDGDLDQADGGLEGLTVTLERRDGSLVASAESDANGAYEFTDLPAGAYRVGAARPSGYRSASTDDPRPVSLEVGEKEGSVDTGFPPEPPPNSDPVAGDDSDTTPKDESVRIKVLTDDTDLDPDDDLEVFDFTQPQNGEVECTLDGVCRFTPYKGFTGSDYFEYAITDGRGGSDAATARIRVRGQRRSRR